MKIHIGECCQHDNKQAGIGIQTGPAMFMVIHSHLLKKFSLKTKETNDPRTANVHYHKASGISYASKCQVPHQYGRDKTCITMSAKMASNSVVYNMTTRQKWTATDIMMEKANTLEMYIINGTWLQTQRDLKKGWEQSELTMGRRKPFIDL